MVPTLQVGQRVLVNRIGSHFTDPSVGDIVVFHPPAGAERGGAVRDGQPPPAALCAQPTEAQADTTFIKRVVAGPGDRLAVRDGHVILNGKRAKEPFARALWRRGGMRLPEEITGSGRPLLHDGRQPWAPTTAGSGDPSPANGSSARLSPPTGLPSGSASSKPSRADPAPEPVAPRAPAPPLQRQPPVPLRPRARPPLRGGGRRGGPRLPRRPAGRRGRAVRLRDADADRAALALGAQRLQAAHDGDARDAVPARAAGGDEGRGHLALRAGDRRARACTRRTWRP